MPFTYSGGDDEFQMLNNDLLKKYDVTRTQMSVMRAQGPGLERGQPARRAHLLALPALELLCGLCCFPGRVTFYQ